MSLFDVKDHISENYANSHAISPFRWMHSLLLIRSNSTMKLSQLNAIYCHLKNSPYIDYPIMCHIVQIFNTNVNFC